MPSSISSESSIIFSVPDGEFEQGGGGEQHETEQISHLRKEVRELKNVVKSKDTELQHVKRQMVQIGDRLAQLEMVDRARRFANTLPPPNSDGNIELQGHKYTPDFGAFIRNGGAYCRDLSISRGRNDNAFHGYPPEFFNELIKHSHETENPDEMVANLSIELALNNSAPWPAMLVQVHAANLGLISKEQLEKDGVPTLKEEKVDYDNKVVHYTMRNKHKPEVGFKLGVYFEGGAKCHEQMTRFTAKRIDVDDGTITFSESGTGSEFVPGEGKEAERISKLENELGELKEQLEEEVQNVQLNTAQMELVKREMADREKENGELAEQNGQMKAQLDVQQKILVDFEERMHGMETGMRALREENDKLLKQHQILADFEERMQGMETEMRAFREENDKWRKQHEKQRNVAELKKLNEEGKTLDWAVKNGDIWLCKRLLELGANLHEKAGMYGNTPLHCASFLNEPKICVLLLDSGARIGEKNNSGNTPLHDAYLFGCHNIVDLLIGRGADKSTKNNNGKMPHEEADRYKHVPMHLRRW